MDQPSRRPPSVLHDDSFVRTTLLPQIQQWDEDSAERLKEEFKKYLDPRDHEIFDSLTATGGCDPAFLVHLGWSHLEFEPVQLAQKIEKVSSRTGKNLKGMKKRLQDLASEIRRLNSVPVPNPMPALERTTFLRLMSAFGAPGQSEQQTRETVETFESLPDVLESYASTMDDWPHRIYRRLASDRNWRSYFFGLAVCLRRVTHRAASL